MTEPMIRTQGLSKRYLVGTQTIEALSELTFSIETGEFVAIMGPSGSGKSTCLHLLGCLQSPSDGQYWFDGQDVSTLGSDQLAEIRNARVGFVFQAFHLLPRATALRNVELPLMYAGVGTRERCVLATAALESVGLGERLEHLPAQLSGGQMQRVAIARALVNSPQLILTDEPTGALDSQASTEVMELLTQLNEKGITVVVVTHDEQTAEYARRVVRLHDGKLIADQATQ